jgi:hypothetical protein
VIEGLAGSIQDPGSKLRFIQRSLEVYEQQPAFLRKASLLKPIAVRLACYGALEELREQRRLSAGPPLPQPSWALYRARHGLLLLLVIGVVYLAYAYGPTGYRAARRGVDVVVELWPPFTPTVAPARAAARRDRDAGTDYPTSRIRPAPEKVWQVEASPQGELWSNGLRILTSYRVNTEPRRYLIFPREGSAPVFVKDKPAGIVYHTSESDMAPFEPGHNSSILRNTRGLLRWLRKHGNYHYLIDRFGRIYRLVEESDVAYHAGKSIWADEDYYYLDLNDSFLGICFESEWKPQADEVELLTPPQIQAAMNLTDMLRAHYGISDTNSVPHGLISVNPKKMLIGHHLDWANGFPFAALGLTNKYEVPLPSIVGFGFSHDEHLVQSMKGDLWPGVEHAERELRMRARQKGVSSAMLRMELRRAYRRHRATLEAAKKNGYSRPPMAAGLGSP